jgi:hypothetical protein
MQLYQLHFLIFALQYHSHLLVFLIILNPFIVISGIILVLI